MKVLVVKKFFIYIILFILILIFLFFLYYVKDYQLCSSTIVYSKPSYNNLNFLLTGKEKVVYLTFDDGPSSIITPKILNILKEENIVASFFVLGKHVKENPEVVKRAYEEGHFIANHGYSHNPNLLYKSSSDFINEIINTDNEIANAIGSKAYCSHVFRFPNGFMSPIYKRKKKALLPSLVSINYNYIDWNALNKDSEMKYSTSKLLSNLKKSIKGKETLVILMHDTGDVNKTYDVLKDSIEYLKCQGYEFKNFYEFINKETILQN